MNLEIRKNLDEVFETAGLLFVSSHFEEIKRDTISNLTNLGHDGKSFYEENFTVFESYVENFQINVTEKNGLTFSLESMIYIFSYFR